MPTTVFYEMFSSDISSIAAGSSDTSGSIEIDIADVELVAIQVKATGADAGNADTIDVDLVGSVDGSNFDTVVFATASLQMNGLNTVRQTTLINVSGLKKIKVKQITNNDSSYAVNNVNVYLGKSLV